MLTSWEVGYAGPALLVFLPSPLGPHLGTSSSPLRISPWILNSASSAPASARWMELVVLPPSRLSGASGLRDIESLHVGKELTPECRPYNTGEGLARPPCRPSQPSRLHTLAKDFASWPGLALALAGPGIGGPIILNKGFASLNQESHFCHQPSPGPFPFISPQRSIHAHRSKETQQRVRKIQ